MIDDANASPDHATYAEYLHYVVTVGIPEERKLTYDEFIGNVEDTVENAKRIKLGFLPPVSPGTYGLNPKDVIGTINAVGDLIDTGVSVVEGVAKASNRARASLKRGMDTASNLTGTPSIMEVETSFDDAGGGSGNTGSGGSGGRFSPFDVRRLNYNAKPIEVRLNTGIPPNVYAPYYLDANINTNTLHLTCVQLFIPDSTVGKLYTFFDQVLSLSFQNASQANLAFNLDVTTNLTTTKIRDYFNAVLSALQVYYFYISVIKYCDYPHNHNAGMIALRQALTSDDLDDLYQLHRILEGIPFPPNLNNLVFYISQNFNESSLPGAPILKICPIGFQTTANNYVTLLNTGKIAAAISGLSAVRSTTAILSKIVPSWLEQEVLSPSNITVHDPQFNTIFANLPAVGYDTAQVRRPFASNTSITRDYFSFVDELDGAVLGLMSFYITTGSYWSPSLVTPENCLTQYSNTKYTNRLSYYYDGINTGFFPAETNTNIANQRNDATIIASSGTTNLTTTIQRHDSEAVLGVSGNTVRETSYKLLEWMMSLDSLTAGAGYDRRNPISLGKTDYVRSSPGRTVAKGSKGNSKSTSNKRRRSNSYNKDKDNME